MKLLLILLTFCTTVLVSRAVAGSLLGRLLHLDSKTTTTTTEQPQRPLFINNNLPTVAANCTAHYACSKKITTVPAPRPCVKYCLKRIDCPNNEKIRGKPNQCVELDETQVLADYQATTPAPSSGSAAEAAATTEKIMEVAMIDFPCQPGYLPDSRGRCREIW